MACFALAMVPYSAMEICASTSTTNSTGSFPPSLLPTKKLKESILYDILRFGFGRRSSSCLSTSRMQVTSDVGSRLLGSDMSESGSRICSLGGKSENLSRFWGLSCVPRSTYDQGCGSLGIGVMIRLVGYEVRWVRLRIRESEHD